MLPVSVEGPALLTTRVKLVVAPTATVLEPTVLLGVMLTETSELDVTVPLLFAVTGSAVVLVMLTALVKLPVGVLATKTMSVIVPLVTVVRVGIVAVTPLEPKTGLKVMVPLES